MIEWKRRYGKYKPLKQPAKCLGCNQKAVHQAYHQLCPPCAEINWAKRHQTAPMHGMVAVVTGGRVR